eukprot:2110231-Rhodomonas_salina.1
MVACSAPSRGVGTVAVSVHNSGTDLGSGSVWFSYTVHRSTLSVSPSKGPIEGGTAITMLGADVGEGA